MSSNRSNNNNKRDDSPSPTLPSFPTIPMFEPDSRIAPHNPLRYSPTTLPPVIPSSSDPTDLPLPGSDSESGTPCAPSSEDEVSKHGPPPPNRYDEPLWHNIKAFVRANPTLYTGRAPANPADPPPPIPARIPYALCPVCSTRELDVIGLPPTFPSITRRPGVILICGHLLCHKCFFWWVKRITRRVRNPLKLACLVCRQVFEGSGCAGPYADHVRPVPLPPSGMRSKVEVVMGLVPLTVPEGRKVRVACGECVELGLADEGEEGDNEDEEGDVDR